jgi:hypothetical protein
MATRWVARQVGEHGLRPTERLLGIDHPLGLAQRRQEGGKGRRVGERSVIAVERQLVGGVCGDQHLQEQPPEQAREHPHGQEEAAPARYPS